MTALKIVENTAPVEEKAIAIVDEAQAIAVNDSNS